jgi:hypothetical protein
MTWELVCNLPARIMERSADATPVKTDLKVAAYAGKRLDRGSLRPAQISQLFRGSQAQIAKEPNRDANRLRSNMQSANRRENQ